MATTATAKTKIVNFHQIKKFVLGKKLTGIGLGRMLVDFTSVVSPSSQPEKNDFPKWTWWQCTTTGVHLR